MATIKEVAQAAQVSATTVSRVLNKDDNISVSAEVRMRIFQAAHSLGYVFSAAKASVRPEEETGDRRSRLADYPSGQAECTIVQSGLHCTDDDR